jgi:hypothetical protein
MKMNNHKNTITPGTCSSTMYLFPPCQRMENNIQRTLEGSYHMAIEMTMAMAVPPVRAISPNTDWPAVTVMLIATN